MDPNHIDIAVLRGRSVSYTDYGDTVGIETRDGRVKVVSVKTFDDLFFRLNEFTCALREDCIHFTTVDYCTPFIIILMNYKGELMDMEHHDFIKHYEIQEEIDEN